LKDQKALVTTTQQIITEYYEKNMNDLFESVNKNTNTEQAQHGQQLTSTAAFVHGLHKEEFRLLVQRVKVLEAFFSQLDDRQKEKLRIQARQSQPSPSSTSLPCLVDAFALDIPADLKQKIEANKRTRAELTFNLALNVSNLNKINDCSDISATPPQPPTKKPKMTEIKSESNESEIDTNEQTDAAANENPTYQDLSALIKRVDELTNGALKTFDSILPPPGASQPSQKAPNTNSDRKKLAKLTFHPDQIRLDASLTNGLTNSTDLPPSNLDHSDALTDNTFGLIEPNDHEILTSKLKIEMTADEIIHACKSHGLNGIQNVCLLKPGRLRERLIKLQAKKMLDSNEAGALANGVASSRSTASTLSDNTTAMDCSDRGEDSDSSDAESDSDSLANDSDSSRDEGLPYGVLGDDEDNDDAREKAAEKENGAAQSAAAPSVVLETKRDAYSSHLQMFCLSQPISVVRGLGNVLKLDLSLFSTKTLVETAPKHLVETRIQRLLPTTIPNSGLHADENTDPAGQSAVAGKDDKTKSSNWLCDSVPSYTTLLKYAKYQAHTFQEAVREEKASNDMGNRRGANSNAGALNALKKAAMNNAASSAAPKTIKFGTNVDLSDEGKWRAQAQELAKLPAFMRCVAPGNMLSHIGYKIDGVNSLQMYLKVPGCRTPGHQENNNMCSLNMNIGPGDCEWFGVSEKHWRRVEALCERNGVDYLKGSWWPNLDELQKAGVPVYRFLQKPGDLVWVNVGCVHWVQSIGWCNNVSWNVGPMCYMQYKSAMERYEWNR
jgi:hypothetical protein